MLIAGIDQRIIKAAAAVCTAAVLFLLSACSLGGDKVVSTPNPYEGAPVTAEAVGKSIILSNNMFKRIYFQVFPTDILPFIEWAPCLAPETCPPEQKVDAGAEKRLKINEITKDKSETVTVFWWHYLEKLPGASIPPMEMEEIKLDLP